MTKIIAAVFAVIILIAAAAFSSKMYEHVGNNEYLIIQHPLSGQMDAYFKGGTYPEYFGTAIHFPRSTHVWFSKNADRGTNTDESLPTNFSDSGHGNISGGAQFDFPEDREALIDLFQTYGTAENVVNHLIRPLLEKSAYMTGPLMNSIESAAEKRNMIPQLIEDQARLGVYQTTTDYTEETDLTSGQKRSVAHVNITKDPKTGAVLRQEESPLARFRIKIYNLTMDGIEYDNKTQSMISAQQEAKLRIAQKITDARAAEQDAITAEAKGKADAATAKWTQEAINATELAKVEKDNEIAVSNQNRQTEVALLQAKQEKDVAETAAEKARDVAKFDADQAVLEKAAKIARGEGDAEAAKLAIQATNYVPEKIKALVQIAELNANAFAQYKGNLVPSFIMGGGENGGKSSGNTVDLLNTLLSARLAESAKALGLDMSLSSGTTAGVPVAATPTATR